MLELYERILEQTKKNGITGKQLAKILGLKKSPLTDWKNNQSNPTLQQLVILCENFAVSSDYLLFGKTVSTNESQKEFINEKEENLLHDFRILSEEEQSDVEEFVKFKLYKLNK
jgi:transcriptional regulator with XRE-family HTH domain